MLDAVQLGKNLRAARLRCDLTQEAVASQLGIPRSGVANIEHGKRAVNTLELARLAKIYDCQLASFLGPDGDAAAENLSAVLFRALPEAKGKPTLDRSVRRLLDLYREGAVLRRMLNQVVSSAIPDNARAMDTVRDALRQGEEAASEERRRLDLGNAPIRNIAKIISDQGVWTVTLSFPASLSGVFVHHQDVGMAILVNQLHHRSRRRFSFAHEYAHALFDRNETVTVSRQQDSKNLMEVRANAFAAAFLMPATGMVEQLAQTNKGSYGNQSSVIFDVANDSATQKEFRKQSRSQAIVYQDVALLARHFGVSYESAVWRLKSLGQINDAEREALMAQKTLGNEFIKQVVQEVPASEGVMGSKTWENELRAQLVRLAVEAFRLGEISPGRIVEIGEKLDIERDRMLELAYAACTDLAG